MNTNETDNSAVLKNSSRLSFIFQPTHFQFPLVYNLIKNLFVLVSFAGSTQSYKKHFKMTETNETVAAAPATTEPTKTAPVEEAPAKPAENGHGDAAAADAEPQTNGNGTAEEAAKEEEKKEDPPKEMRSIVLTGFGGFKGVKILKKPEPTAQAGEVLIRVRAW